jgi:hypothetical protein
MGSFRAGVRARRGRHIRAGLGTLGHISPTSRQRRTHIQAHFDAVAMAL